MPERDLMTEAEKMDPLVRVFIYRVSACQVQVQRVIVLTLVHSRCEA